MPSVGKLGKIASSLGKFTQRGQWVKYPSLPKGRERGFFYPHAAQPLPLGKIRRLPTKPLPNMKFGITVIEQPQAMASTVAMVVCDACGKPLSGQDIVYWYHDKPNTLVGLCTPCEDRLGSRLSTMNSITVSDWLKQLLASAEQK